MLEIKIISSAEGDRLVDAWCAEEDRISQEEFRRENRSIPQETWLCQEDDGAWTVIDNGFGDCWVDTFDTEGMALCNAVGWCDTEGIQTEAHREPYMVAAALDLIDENGNRVSDDKVQPLLDEALARIYDEDTEGGAA